MNEIILLIVISLFGIFYIFGGVHALFDGWKPWKNGIQWWKKD
jgi:hypothetical protein